MLSVWTNMWQKHFRGLWLIAPNAHGLGRPRAVLAFRETVLRPCQLAQLDTLPQETQAQLRPLSGQRAQGKGRRQSWETNGSDDLLGASGKQKAEAEAEGGLKGLSGPSQAPRP